MDKNLKVRVDKIMGIDKKKFLYDLKKSINWYLIFGMQFGSIYES